MQDLFNDTHQTLPGGAYMLDIATLSPTYGPVEADAAVTAVAATVTRTLEMKE